MNPDQPTSDATHETGRGFFQLPWVQKVLPIVTSLSLHLGLLLIGFLTFTAIKIIHQPPARVPQLPSDVEVLNESPLQGLHGFTDDKPWLRTAQDQDPLQAAVNGADLFTGVKHDLAGGGAGDDAAVIAVGIREGFGRNGGIGPGHGPTSGVGPGGGDEAPYGLPNIGGVKNPVFTGPPARKIAYVCDCSGSMINKMPTLKEQLANAVNALRPIQSFSIIFFRGGQPDVMDSSLVLATPQNKRKAVKFLDGVTAFSTTDPIPAIEAAFRQKPELIFLLTDGDFPDNDAVLSRVRALYKEHHARINTIAFVGSGDSDTAFIALLQGIAKETGGTYKHVAEEEVP